MRSIAWLIAFAGVLVVSTAQASPRVPRHGAFGAFLTEVASAARRNDMRAIRRLTDREFTIGEELGRAYSLATLGRDTAMRHWLAMIADHGACYRTSFGNVQCELPDPGPNLNHMRLAHSSIAIFEHTRHGWKLVALFV